jgi:hypothetical protein
MEGIRGYGIYQGECIHVHREIMAYLPLLTDTYHMDETLPEGARDILERLASIEKTSLEYYRNCLKALPNPQIKRFVMTIIDQKEEKTGRILHFCQTMDDKTLKPGTPYPSLPPLPAENRDEISLMETIVGIEKALAQAYADLDALHNEDDLNSGLLASLAGDSKKHASWAQDHIDLARL